MLSANNQSHPTSAVPSLIRAVNGGRYRGWVAVNKLNSFLDEVDSGVGWRLATLDPTLLLLRLVRPLIRPNPVTQLLDPYNM